MLSYRRDKKAKGETGSDDSNRPLRGFLGGCSLRTPPLEASEGEPAIPIPSGRQGESTLPASEYSRTLDSGLRNRLPRRRQPDSGPPSRRRGGVTRLRTGEKGYSRKYFKGDRHRCSQILRPSGSKSDQPNACLNSVEPDPKAAFRIFRKSTG